MTLSNSTIEYIITFLDRIKNQISNEISKHNSKTASSSAKGHVQAGTNVGYADVSGGSVGTDNGIYARADHQHSLSSAYASASHTHSYSTLTDKPTLSSLSTQTGELNIKDVAGLEDYIGAGFDIYIVEDFNQSDIEETGFFAKDGQLGVGFYKVIEDGVTETQREFPNGTDSLKPKTIYMVYNEGYTYCYEILCYSHKFNESLECEQLGSTQTELPSIINNLTSTDSTAALSAAQGKVLNDNKIDTAGTGLSKSRTTLNHSNSVTALTTSSLKKIKHDAQGHITGTDSVSGTDLPAHTNSTASSIGQATASVFGHTKATSTAPVDIDLSSSAVGTDNGLYARGDHKHKHPTGTAKTGNPTANQTPTFGGSFTITQFTSNATGHISGATDRTITIPSTTATTSANGLMSSTDKSKLDGMITDSLILTYNDGSTKTITFYKPN